MSEDMKTFGKAIILLGLALALMGATTWQDQHDFADSIKVDTVYEHTSAAGVTLDGIKLKDSVVYTDTIAEKTSAAGVTADGIKLKDSVVYTDTIAEKTGATGVTADGVLLKDGGATLTADLNMGSAVVVQSEQMFIPAAVGRAGATATVGYVNTGTNASAVTLAQSATADTWVIPITGLNVGDTVTAFKVVAQIESAGNTATLDANLRKLTNAAADPTDASVDSITQVSATADTAVASSKTLGTPEVVASGEALYVLITVTTAASTDAQLLGIELTVTKGN